MRHRHRFHYALLILFLLPLVLLIAVPSDKSSQTTKSEAQTATTPTTTVVAKGLEVPWALAFLPDGNILVTERPGRVKLVTAASGQVTDVATIAEVKASGEGGLLGIALHPQFATNKFVYVYYTYGGTGGENTLNRVARYTFNNNQLTAPATIVDAIPGASNHNGGRIKFGPDGFLYIAAGDAAVPSSAQDKNSLAGKILRVTDAGQPAPGNPFGNRTYSYGHRNPQGLTWNGSTMYAAEHGNSFKDEVNHIEAGKNYGWPTIEGDATQADMVTPLANSGSNSWAPSGAAFFNGSIFFAGLKGSALFEAKPEGAKATVSEHFKGQFGRIREAIVGPDNQLYITTSNRDGRGTPKADDDQIIKVNFGTPGTPGTSTAPGNTNPTFGVIAPCPSCVNPVTSTIPSQPMTGGGGVISAPVQPIVSTQPTDPCQASDVQDNTRKKNKHKKHKGGISKIGESILKFLIQLIMLLLQLITGGGQGAPLSPGETPNPNPIPDPCAPSSGTVPPPVTPVDTVAPQPTTPVATPGPSSSAAVPTTAAFTPVTSTAPVLGPAEVAPQQPAACIPSGQKCDPTGARQCCTTACTKNINPNFPNDPGTCD